MISPEHERYRMSQRGWVSLEYDQNVWIPCPFVFPDGADRDSWAQLYAEEWWARSGRAHSRTHVQALARTLIDMHKFAYGNLPMQNGLIHLPSLQVVPLLVGIGVWEAVGDRLAQLRVLTRADDPDAAEQPIVEEFATDRLGPGLKVLAYSRRRQGRIIGHLYYAWRSEELATAIRMFTGGPDLGRLQLAIPDVERLAWGMSFVPLQPSS